MIAYLRGKILEPTEEGLILNVNGVGYELFCSSNTIDVSMQMNESEFWVHTVMREDALSLYGFATKVEKEMFLSLIKVNGVGPKMAIKILSGAGLDNLAQMIEAGDVKALTNLPKVGRKTAEQMILTLKGKLVLSIDERAVARSPRKSLPLFEGVKMEISSALVNLGFKQADVQQIIEAMPENIEFQTGVRMGLQVLSGHVPFASLNSGQA